MRDLMITISIVCRKQASCRLPADLLLLLCALLALVTVQQPVQAQASSDGLAELIPQNLLGLVHAPEVHRDLNLSEPQVKRLEALFAEIDGPWFQARILPADKQRLIMAQLEKRVHKWFEQYATEAQRERMQQLEFRSQSFRMLLRDEIRQALELTSSQVEKLAAAARSTEQAKQKLHQANGRGEGTPELQAAVKAANEAEQQAFQSVVRPEQMQKLRPLLGEAFDATQLQRIYPMAPELVPVEHWINSEPITMEQLRGKVVLVHFYAFQCHNCHANFDHYRRWHEQLREKGVVVIGIQSPETERERDPQAVRAAAAERKLDFPILVDLEMENWKAWSNTMWPTIYVVDKRGYLRHWWQGELNWQGATGDQTIEQLVERLLEEDA